ncbi:MAG: hypothetical protein JNK87_27760 [Bryobacterales bacterium]|nr:hypothetical protein [Bryobacterales bacterium]
MRQVFEIVPASGSAIQFFALILAIPLAMVVLFAFFWYSMRHTTFEVSADGIRIRGDVYGRTIPLDQLRLEKAKVYNMAEDAEHGLSWRTNGVGMPGYSSGWFRLKNGEKALVFLTARNRVLYVPTSEDYALVVSPKDSDALLQALREAKGGAAR